MLNTHTSDPIVAPVTTQELADYLKLDDDSDPVLNGLLIAATDAAIQFMGRNIINRDYVMKSWDWQIVGNISSSSVAPVDGYYTREYSLPYGGIESVSSVKVYGDAITDYVVRNDSLVVKYPPLFYPFKTNDDPALEVAYTAGMAADASGVPVQIKQAVLAIASVMYEHRGGCDLGDVMNKSGARFMLNSYRKAQVLI